MEPEKIPKRGFVESPFLDENLGTQLLLFFRPFAESISGSVPLRRLFRNLAT